MRPIRLDTDPRFAGRATARATNPADVRAWLWRRIETGELPVSDLAALHGPRLASPGFPALASVVASAAAWAASLSNLAPVRDAGGVPGLVYVPGFLPAAEQARVVAAIDASPWSTALRRRTQHYGWRYDYRSRSLDDTARLGPLPPWAAGLATRLRLAGLVAPQFDQCIVNEYIGAQGIAPHVDMPGIFGPVVATVSLLEAWTMRFASRRNGRPASLRLAPGSVLLLTGEARYDWTHSIAPSAAEPDGTARGRRISATFRLATPRGGA